MQNEDEELEALERQFDEWIPNHIGAFIKPSNTEDDELDPIDLAMERARVEFYFGELPEADRSLIGAIGLLRRGLSLCVNTDRSKMTDNHTMIHDLGVQAMEASFTEIRKYIYDLHFEERMHPVRFRMLERNYLTVPFKD